MTRKDYERIAEAIRESRVNAHANDPTEKEILDAHSVAIGDVAINIASALQKENPQFDRNKFLRACGVGE